MKIAINKAFVAVSTVLIVGMVYNFISIKELKSTVPSVTEVENKETGSKSELGKYILENPTVIIASLKRYREELAIAEQNASNELIRKNYDKIYSENSFVIGNPDADIKMVEFFDYNCGYCKEVTKTLTKLVSENPNIKIYMKDTPILGASSTAAAKAAIAAGLLGKYKEYSAKLMSYKGTLNEAAFREIAEEVGLPENDLIEMMHSQKVSEIMMENRLAASIVELKGTPTVFIETDRYLGDYSKGALKAAIRAQMEKSIE